MSSAVRFQPRFATPGVLNSLEPELLRRFLRPHGDWLKGAGIDLSGPLDLDALSLLLMAGSGLPADLIESLCAIDELSKPAMYDGLLGCAKRAKVRLDGPVAGPDLALRVMLADPALVQELRVETASLRPKRIERYMAMTPEAPDPKRDIAKCIKKLEAALDDEFQKRQRGRGARLYHYDEPRGFRLMVRRGDTLRSQPVIDDDAQTRRLLLRPELYDVVRYDRRHGDLLVNAKAKADVRAYCFLVGEHLFADRFLFDPHLAPKRYTLEPIREHGLAALTHADIAGIEGVRLVLLQLAHPKDGDAKVTLDANDVLASLSLLGGHISPEAVLKRAIFKIRLAGEERERRVKITPPIGAVYERDDGGEAVESFIENRGFLLPREESLRGAPDTLFTLY